MAKTERSGIKSVKKSLKIIEALDELNGARVNELADHLEYSTSTIYDHLVTLQNQGYLICKGDIYENSLKHLYISEGVRQRYQIDEVRMGIKEIARETGEIATYVVKEGHHGVFVFRENGGNDLKTARIGTEISLHNTAAGKAILAHLSETEWKEILDQGLPKETENTITDEGELFNELEQVRDQGYALNYGERITRLHSAAVPIRDASERAIGAIAVTGPRARMKEEYFQREIPDLLMTKADKIELNIAHAGDL